MTDLEILGKVFNKASKRNSKFCPFAYNIKEVICGLVSFEKFIFSPDFAKAFWGEEFYHFDSRYGVLKQQHWQYRRQQMVLEPEPLKYLEKFL